MDRHVSWRRDDDRGAVAVVTALVLTVLCLAAALAIDLGNETQTQTSGQTAVEDAAISGAGLLGQGSDSLSAITTAAEAYVADSMPGMKQAWNSCPSSSMPSGFTAGASGEDCISFNGTSTASADEISVALPPQAVSFGPARVAGVTGTKIYASAIAKMSGGTAQCVLCVLDATGTSLQSNGSGTVSVTDPDGGDAGIIVDSNSQPAATLTGSGSVQAPTIDIVGTDQDKGSGSFSPTPTTGASPVSDPLAFLPAYAPSPATIPSGTYSLTGSNSDTMPQGSAGNVDVSSSGTATISPGNYDNITVSGSGGLILNSGTYVITGSLSVKGSGSIQTSGGGVFLYFACQSGSSVVACSSGQTGGSLSLSGSGSVDLSALTSGVYQGVTVFYDRNDASTMTLKGSGSFSFSGTVYAKSADVTLSGSGSSLSSMMVANTVTLSGSGSIDDAYDPSLNVPIPGGPYLCATASC